VNPLTRRQRRQVACYLHFKDKPMSVASLFWFNRRIYAVILPVAALSGVVAYWLGESCLLAIVLAAYGTMLLRDAAYYWRSKEVWPVLQQTLAWDKLQQLSDSGVAA